MNPQSASLGLYESGAQGIRAGFGGISMWLVGLPFPLCRLETAAGGLPAPLYLCFSFHSVAMCTGEGRPPEPLDVVSKHSTVETLGDTNQSSALGSRKNLASEPGACQGS